MSATTCSACTIFLSADAEADEEGLEALGKTWLSYTRGIARHFGRHLTDEETRVLTEALSKVLAAAR
jgi:hypothetical protein